MKDLRNKGRSFIAMMLVFIMVLSLAGCSKENESTAEKPESTVESNSADTTVTETPEPTGPAETGKEQENLAESEDSSTEENVIPTEELSETESDLSSISGNNEDVAPARSLEDNSTVVSAETENKEIPDPTEEVGEALTPTMRNSINMLNYMTSLTQKVNEEKSNQLFLESAYNSFDNLFPNSVDTKTQAQITSLMDTIQGYRMISVKRERLEYIYEQNRAQALRQAIPNPLGLLSAVESGSLLKAAASVLYMAVDSANSYKKATSQADLQFIKDGWELDDAESEELHNSTKAALTYMLDMVRNYDIPGDYALSRGAVEDFVFWSRKPDKELERKISWFETNEGTYNEFGPYWLELAKDYYNYQDYAKCLDAVDRYESISTRIFRKDLDYATVLPMAIISAKETKSEQEYVRLASNYCRVIHDNTEDENWTLRYFSAQTYMDLYHITKDRTYLDEAYKIARENVVVLVDEQTKLNEAYLADVQEVKVEKDATKREKDEAKNYNKAIKEERKTALPPVSEALYLNTDLLFALANERNIDSTEKKKIESILHVDGENIFLTQALDDKFWFDEVGNLDPAEVEVTFDGDSFSIPASCVTDRSIVNITVSGDDGSKSFNEWIVDEVDRPKGSKDCSGFIVSYSNKEADKYKYKDGELVTITVTPVAESPDEHLEFKFNALATKKLFVFNGIKFERAE